jgi:hypothetical protein
MFKYKFIIVIAVFILSASGYAQENNLELGVRYLKLGNSYLYSKNYDLAEKYLLKGQNIVKGKNKYWEAVSYEYMGYFYLNAKNDKPKAMEFLNKAQLLYKEIVDQKDGSPVAMESLLDLTQFQSNNNMQSDPVKGQNITNKTGSEIMNCDSKKLRELPTDIPSNIKNLSMADNKFRDFPADLTNFSNLEYLNLENNKIKELPEDIGNMKNLKYLNLSGNKIKKLPESICSMKNLKMLDLKRNKISFEDISNLIRCLPNTNILFDEYILKPSLPSEEVIPGVEE